MSTNAILRVWPDTTAPVLLSAALVGEEACLLSFSEPFNALTWSGAGFVLEAAEFIAAPGLWRARTACFLFRPPTPPPSTVCASDPHELFLAGETRAQNVLNGVPPTAVGARAACPPARGPLPAARNFKRNSNTRTGCPRSVSRRPRLPPMKFSIITPSFRNSDWLKLCLASVADQGVEHEHIVQDAGSDDGTLDWLRGDRRVQAFVEKDAGMYDGINRGLRRASGDILAHLNCDEQYLPGALPAVSAYFEAHPEIEMVFADAVAVNGAGEYLWHRKMLRPLLWHTWTCPLATLTCATFFRRSVIERRQIFFDTRWRYVGDSDWMRRLIQQRVPMAVLRRFTSVFTHTGENLSLAAKAQEEAHTFFATAPALARGLRPAVLAHHRVRRLAGGIYQQAPFAFDLHTQSSPGQRETRRADKPTFRWRW